MLRLSSRAILFLSVFALILMVMPAYSATITTYSNLSAWQAAVSGVQTDNFEGLAPAGSYTAYQSGIFQNNVEFLGYTGGETGVADTSSGTFSWANFGTGEAGFVTGDTSVAITLPSSATGFGISLFTGPAALTYGVTVLGNSYSAPTFSAPTPAFFGVTSDTPFTSLSLQVPSGATYAFFDNFSWGTAQATGGTGSQAPEAGTFLLIGSGLLALAVTRRRKARQPR